MSFVFVIVKLFYIQLLDACVANCGRPFHLEMASRDFISECRTLLSGGKVAENFILKKLVQIVTFYCDSTVR